MGELSILDIVKLVLRKIWFVVGVTVICALAALIISNMITPKYRATASMYVRNAVNVTENNATAADITAAEKLVESYIVVLQSDKVMNQILDATKLNYNISQLKSMIRMSSINGTQVLQVQVTSTSKQNAVTIANALVNAAPEILTQVAKVGSVEALDLGTIEQASKVSPNVTRNTVIGFLLGFVLAVLIVLMRAMLDRTIKGEEDVSEYYDVAVLGCVPDFNSMEKGGYVYYAK
jgi:capsular polysaccharide biosynthesis protein